MIMMIVPCMFDELDACAVFAHLKLKNRNRTKDICLVCSSASWNDEKFPGIAAPWTAPTEGACSSRPATAPRTTIRSSTTQGRLT